MKPDKTYQGRSTIRMYNCDCMDLMETGKWDLAIVDPPYGMDVIKKIYEGRENYTTYTRGSWVSKSSFSSKKWDINPPNKGYFQLLYKSSNNQIIWGANNFTSYIPMSSGWIFWDKCTGDNDFSDGEFAFTSFEQRGRMFRFMWNGMLQGKGIKKGILIREINNYVKQGFTLHKSP